jgi:5-methylcytosine-specific restriction endonuclease McrA
LSVPAERIGLDEEYRDIHGRLFTQLSPDYLQLLYERVGFVLLDKWVSNDSLGREGHSWHVFLFQIRYPSGSRPIDIVDGILNRDRKTATYKLALFRALAEIATKDFEHAQWINQGIVGIPISIISEKWLYYYWPILESPIFIPQIRGESPVCSKPIAFRALLSELSKQYQSYGGFTRFVLDYKTGDLPRDTNNLLRRALTKISNTIISGPVTFAGGSLDIGPIFSYDSIKQIVLISADIWRELSLVGHWIQDAVVLRWAELTHDISKQEIRPSQMIELLLPSSIYERDVIDARKIYEGLEHLYCSWTGKHISQEFEVDHITPFSLWHNNDLWNLVPVAPSINLSKSDKLPTLSFLRKCQESIIEYWEILREAYKNRFEYEASHFIGRTSLNYNWQGNVFQTVCDAVEFTALQRGCERWEP